MNDIITTMTKLVLFSYEEDEQIDAASAAYATWILVVVAFLTSPAIHDRVGFQPIVR